MDSIQPGSFRAYADAALQRSNLERARDAQERPVCERCSDFADELFPVEDRDDSVGYHDELMVCQTCIDKLRRRA